MVVTASLSHLTCALIISLVLFSLLFVSIFITVRSKTGLKSKSYTDDVYLSARNTQSWLSVGLAVYSSGMGSWLLFATPESGMNAGVVGVLGYGISTCLPFILMSFLGPAVRRSLGGASRGFTMADFVRERYGRAVQFIFSAASLFFMFIFLCAELTSIGTATETLSDGFPVIPVVISVATVTIVYTVFGGISTTLVTDRIQGVLLMALGLLAATAVGINIVGRLLPGKLYEAAKPTQIGFIHFSVLVLSVTINQILDQSMWQRVFAAKSDKDAQYGLILGGCLTMPTVVAFGMTGVFAAAAQKSKLFPSILSDSNAFFVLLKELPTMWLGIVLFLSMGLVCSTVDSIQNALTGLLAGELLQQKKSLLLAPLGCILINIFAVIVATLQFSVLRLFLVSNILSCAVVPLTAFAFWSRATPLSVTIGILSGLLSIFVTGWITLGTFSGGFEWFMLPYGPYNLYTAITFVLVPLTTIIVIACASELHCRWVPDTEDIQKARLCRMKLVLDKPASFVYVNNAPNVYTNTTGLQSNVP